MKTDNYISLKNLAAANSIFDDLLHGTVNAENFDQWRKDNWKRVYNGWLGNAALLEGLGFVPVTVTGVQDSIDLVSNA